MEFVGSLRRYFNPRSRTGSDVDSCTSYSKMSHFNPRSRTGSDGFRAGELDQRPISTHAPAQGATPPHHLSHYTVMDFNPRSRTGSDRIKSISGADCPAFQPTLPHRERLSFSSNSFIASATSISTHAPAQGATSCSISRRDNPPVFQPTLPHRERPNQLKIICPLLLFQPTLPHRERLRRLKKRGKPVPISTHAPAQGATPTLRSPGRPVDISTHAPAQGATRATYSARSLSVFQPTLPHRERRYLVTPSA